ncbi:DUF4230 domain-containing protein [Nocardioides perillae]|uniref:Multidrug efflux pump subunit AcrA (Membrane-fusion protein) n=1 Tax=Nocardioides perillae TaxID=1119534 RepID=A0A7Y9RTC9_9ACTN|nr:multidrug efflux pump subunit AcrA (membrane-fusion protein) [Nocardioides perillae]
MRVLVRAVSVLLIGGVLAIGGVVALTAVGLVDFKWPFSTTTIDRSQPVLLESVQDVNRYVGAVGNLEVVVDLERDVEWLPGFLAGERSLFVAAGTVDAYVDLASLEAGDLVVSDDRTKVTITLPSAVLGEPNLDQDRTYLFDQERGVLDRLEDALSTPDQQELYQEAESKIGAAAEASDLKDQAEANTEAMLVGMFAGMDMTTTVTFDE